MRRRALLSAPLGLLAGRAEAQPRPPARPTPPLAPTVTPENLGLSSQRLAQVVSVLETAVAEGRIAGAVFGMVRHGKPAFLAAAGYRDAALSERLKPDALFPLGSMTKPLASVAALTLVERARILLTDPLTRSLPAFLDTPVLTPEGREIIRRPITVEDLFRHTAGFINGQLYPDTPLGRLYIEAGVYDPARPLSASIDRLAKLPLLRQPGLAWDYSIATDILARVVEVAAGQSFANFLADRVTGPLGMVDTRYAVPAADWGRIAEPRPDPLTGHAPDTQDARTQSERIGGNSGLVGTAADYLRFCQMILNGGVLDGARILGSGTVANMTRDHLGPIGHDTPSGLYLLGPGRGFGLGFAIRLPGGGSAQPGSEGDLDWGGAFGTQFVIDPREDMAAVLLVNQQNQFDWIFRVFRTLVYQTLAR
jgi:CubicO group peptidase (beta-lactamase class C family)